MIRDTLNMLETAIADNDYRTAKRVVTLLSYLIGEQVNNEQLQQLKSDSELMAEFEKATKRVNY